MNKEINCKSWEELGVDNWALNCMVKEFLTKRFQSDCSWLNGNCYYMALILADRFRLDIYYDPIAGHFIAGNGKVYFDWNGLYEQNREHINKFDNIAVEDPVWYSRLIKDCTM